MMIIGGLTQSYSIHLFPICSQCAELDARFAVKHGIISKKFDCMVCGENLSEYNTSGPEGIVESLRRLLQFRKRDEKIDNILL
jgi:hypothetical protein